MAILLDKLPIESNLIMEKILDHFYSAYIMDINNDLIYPIKVSERVKPFIANGVIPWSELAEVLTRSVDINSSREDVIHFFSKEHIKNAFLFSDEEKEMVYLQAENVWRRAVLRPIKVIDGFTSLAMITIIDISEARAQYERLVAKNQKIESDAEDYSYLFFNAAVDMYISILKINLVEVSAVRLEFHNNKLIETSFPNDWNTVYDDIIRPIHPNDVGEVKEKTNYDALMKYKQGTKIVVTYRSTVLSQDYRWYSSVIRIYLNHDKQKIVTIFTSDINNDIIERARLKDISERDQLTDLFNRNKLEIMLENEYRNLKSCAVLFFDLNNLKIANDQFGHEYGDKLICEAADSIRSLVNRNIHAYRYGGDEFIVVACNIKESTINTLVNMWKSRLKALIEETGIPCSLAYGASWASDNFSIYELIRIADAEMYKCKSEMKKLIKPA